jgi:hypothetical protein
MAAGTAAQAARRRLAPGLHAAVYLLSLAAIGVTLNFFAQRSPFRAQLDATKTRVYSLSEQTRRLLATLRGEWTIALLLVEQDADRAMRRQLDEVLRQFSAAAPGLRVARIDPTNPRTLAEYERVLADLRLQYAGLTVEYEQAIAASLDAFDALRLFAQQQAALWSDLAPRLPAESPARPALGERFTRLELLAQASPRIRAQVEEAVRVDSGRPLPDYETARSILAATLTEMASSINDLAQDFTSWSGSLGPDAPAPLASARVRSDCDAMARRAAMAADPLRRLPPLELATIGRQMQAGEVALVLGPPGTGAAVIPSSQFLPKSNLRQTEDGIVQFDQRFRGEQVVAAAIRSLLVDRLPTVVFVHAQGATLLKSQEGQADLVGAAAMLTTSRYPVAEWDVSVAEQPPADVRSAVWVIVPPPLTDRRSVAPTPDELKLVRAAQRLIDDGEPVLLSLYPSAMHKFRQPDPWQALPRALGLEVDTSRVVFQSARRDEDTIERLRWQEIESYPPAHPISQALSGQKLRCNLPIPVRPLEARVSGVRHEVIAAVEPEVNHTSWLETDWLTNPESHNAPPAENLVRQSLPLAIAVDRPHPVEQRRQRCLVIGCGDWMLTRIADVVMRFGGQRAALVYPGNHELMLASVAWLADLDDLIAPGPASQSVARLAGISAADRKRWFWIIVAGMPAAFLLTGGMVWFVRRH